VADVRHYAPSIQPLALLNKQLQVLLIEPSMPRVSRNNDKHGQLLLVPVTAEQHVGVVFAYQLFVVVELGDLLLLVQDEHEEDGDEEKDKEDGVAEMKYRRLIS